MTLQGVKSFSESCELGLVMSIHDVVGFPIWIIFTSVHAGVFFFWLSLLCGICSLLNDVFGTSPSVSG